MESSQSSLKPTQQELTVVALKQEPTEVAEPAVKNNISDDMDDVLQQVKSRASSGQQAKSLERQAVNKSRKKLKKSCTKRNTSEEESSDAWEAVSEESAKEEEGEEKEKHEATGNQEQKEKEVETEYEVARNAQKRENKAVRDKLFVGILPPPEPVAKKRSVDKVKQGPRAVTMVRPQRACNLRVRPLNYKEPHEEDEESTLTREVLIYAGDDEKLPPNSGKYELWYCILDTDDKLQLQWLKYEPGSGHLLWVRKSKYYPFDKEDHEWGTLPGTVFLRTTTARGATSYRSKEPIDKEKMEALLVEVNTHHKEHLVKE